MVGRYGGLWDGVDGRGRQINRLSYIKDLNFNFFQISCHLNALVRPSGQGGGVGEGRSIPPLAMPHELIVWQGLERGGRSKAGRGNVAEIVPRIEIFSAASQQQQQQEEEEARRAMPKTTQFFSILFQFFLFFSHLTLHFTALDGKGERVWESEDNARVQHIYCLIYLIP